MFKNDQIQIVFLGLNRKIILFWLKTNYQIEILSNVFL